MSEQKPGRPHAKADELFARAAGLIAALSCFIASFGDRAASAFVTTRRPGAAGRGAQADRAARTPDPERRANRFRDCRTARRANASRATGRAASPGRGALS